MLFSKTIYEPVSEAFIGKTNNLKKAEKELDKIIQMLQGYGEFNMDSIKIINFSSASKQLNSLLSDEFGTSIRVNFTAQPMMPGGGAYTFINSTPLSTLSVAKEFEETRKIKSHERLLPVFITIDYNIIVRDKLTSAELMGILLHEIGHNIRHIAAFDSLNLFSILVSRPIIGSVLGTADEILSVISGIPVISHLIKFKNILGNAFKDITGERINALSTLVLLSTKAFSIASIFDPLRHFGGYQNERYSDSLATAYGYGPSLSSGLLKIHNVTKNSTFNKVVRSNLIISFGDTLLMTFMDIVMMISMQTVHPTVGHRIKNCLNKLKRDLAKNDYPADVKASLASDIKELEKMYESYLNADDAQKNQCVQFYRQYVEKYGVNPLRNIALDKAYQELEV